ncbi:protein kinase domain-containing protein [Citrus sinensis]|nr:protein kinase domain-containing protein [Citrus sinensis]
MERIPSLISMMIRLLFIHCLIHSLIIAASANTSIDIDQDALLALKDHITYDPTNFFAKNWLTNSTMVCNWTGVTCDINQRRVTALNISYLSLTGNIPRQLGNLSSLEILDLNFNRLSGEIPWELGNLAKLEKLLLHNNFLTGTIPFSIFKLSSLLDLKLSDNNLTGTIPSHNLGNLSSLQLLDLSDNQLSGSIPSFIFKISSLQALHFGNNRLSGELPANICDNLPFLNFFSVYKNMFYGGISSTLSNCKHLRILDLSFNDLWGDIPKEIGNLTKLKELFLDFNILQGEIPHTVGNLHNLEYLSLVNNELVGTVPATIFNVSTLKLIELSNNTFFGSLPSSTDVQLPNLEELYLWGNNFSGTLPSFIFNASNLSKLSLGDNSFSGLIPNTFGNLRNLKRLRLYNNYLTSPELSFLSSLSNCKYLEIIALSGNPLNGIIPMSAGNLSHSLEELFMPDCNVSGRIPKEIGNLANLVTLDLGGNKFNGSIPIALGKLQKLQLLNLDDNKLEGSIPDDICGLVELYKLALGDNKLSGQIPACFGNLASLRELWLGPNELISFIPSTFWNIKDIMYVNFSSNFLTGPLPLEIENLKALTTLDFSMNNLSGVIPTTIGGLKGLQYLFLGHNRLQGSIPDSVGDLISLKSLNLSNNNLSGPIPTSLEKLSDLKELNLSFNKLEGEIPRGGPFVNFSAKSFMGNNLLCGSPNLQVPPCRASIDHISKKNALLLGIILPFSTIFVIVIILLISRYQTRGENVPNEVNVPLEATWRRFSYLELFQATNGFSENNLIGRGSFGSVYIARLQNGIEVAVKTFDLQHERAFKSFDTECEVMKSIRHRNLTKIISSCSNEDFKALILEYMRNGSLEKCLYSGNYILDIFQRLNIMIDVASALEYLHFGYSAPVIHCDLKPSNVLLDDNMVAHLSDFGIAKLLIGEDQSMTQTQTLATLGYMAPEYGREGRVSTKGDVYSFGILLMETFTRRKPTDEIFSGEMTLKHWVNDFLPISMMKIIDANLLITEDKHFAAKEQCASSVFNLAMECTVESPDERITAKEIVRRLLKIRDFLLRNVES